MAKKEFKFLDAYRIAVPAATREVVEARQKAHAMLYPLIQQLDRIYDLCRISFELPFDKEVVAEWFEKTVKGQDLHFSLDVDKAEASRIATLLLRDLVWQGPIQCVIVCLAASYCGRRVPVGGGDLLVEAREALDAAGNERRIVLADREIAMPRGKDLKAVLDAAQTKLEGPTFRAALDAVSSDLRDSANELAVSANDAFASLRSDATRLAEELDMLWWYIGDWSELLGKPRAGLSEATKALVSAVELGDLVRAAPGPYGAYGILRRALGTSADTKTTLKASIENLGSDELQRLTEPLPARGRPLFPVQAAINFAADRGTKDWGEALTALLGSVPSMNVSHYELAVQTFRERVLIGMGGLGQ